LEDVEFYVLSRHIQEISRRLAEEALSETARYGLRKQLAVYAAKRRRELRNLRARLEEDCPPPPQAPPPPPP
jgi:hypothetical protein